MRIPLRSISLASDPSKLTCSVDFGFVGRLVPFHSSLSEPCALTQRPCTSTNRTTILLTSTYYVHHRKPTVATLATKTKAESSPEQEGAKLVVLTTVGCQYCRKTKTALSDAGITFKDFDLSTNLDALKRVKETTGRQSVPQVFVDGNLLGGCSETLDLIKSGKLAEMLTSKHGPALPQELADIVQANGNRTSQGDIADSVTPEGMSSDKYRSLSQLTEHLRALATPQQNGLFSARSAFTAGAARRWLQDQGEARDDSAASQALSAMLDAHLLYEFDGATSDAKRIGESQLLGFTVDALKASDKKQPLNSAFRWRRKARSASKVAEILRQIILRLFEKHLSDNGKGVKYGALASDPDFWRFATATAELQGIDPSSLNREECIAFFLNIYNVLIVHAQVAFGGPSNFLSRLSWFSSIKYEIGGLEYSADDIEHGILRGNRPSAAALPVLLGHPEWSRGFFKSEDPRKKQVQLLNQIQAVKDMDKRIHFALNCGAKSCPPIKVYTPETLEEGLQSAAATFCEGEVTVDEADRSLQLSKLFKWYGMDFGSKAQLVTWLLDYLPEKEKAALQRLQDQHGVDSIKLIYKDYDWGLNDG